MHVFIRPGSSPDGTGGYVADASAAYENQAFYVDRGKMKLPFSHKTIIHLVYSSKFCITNFSSVLRSSQKKSKTMVMQFFFFGGGWGGVNKVQYGACENGQSGLFCLFVKAVKWEVWELPTSLYKESFSSLCAKLQHWTSMTSALRPVPYVCARHITWEVAATFSSIQRLGFICINGDQKKRRALGKRMRQS